MAVSNCENRKSTLRDDERDGLPGWTYHSAAFLELEKEHLFRRHWQIACHVNDIPGPGDFSTLDLVDDRLLILRDRGGEVRAFHNLCRHRGARVVAADHGTCRHAIVCPFHGWVYDLDGRLRGPARPETFGSLDRSKLGLKPVELEIWNGFVFVRIKPGPQPPIAEMMAPYEEELSHYGLSEVIPSAPAWTDRSPVNWKSVRDVDNEGYHVALAHPALQDLYGASYEDGPFEGWVCRSAATCNPVGGRRWSVRHYLRITTPCTDLPQHQTRDWLYYTIFPNNVIAVTPESAQFYQEFPLTTGQTLLRGSIYRHGVETRQQRLARYLAARIDRETMAEDVQLTVWSHEAMRSSAFEGFVLSDLEVAVRNYHDLIRQIIPIATEPEYPGEERLTALSRTMAGGSTKR